MGYGQSSGTRVLEPNTAYRLPNDVPSLAWAAPIRRRIIQNMTSSEYDFATDGDPKKCSLSVSLSVPSSRSWAVAPGSTSGVGAPGRTRTSDTRFRRPVLYPLSYEGATCPWKRKCVGGSSDGDIRSYFRN